MFGRLSRAEKPVAGSGRSDPEVSRANRQAAEPLQTDERTAAGNVEEGKEAKEGARFRAPHNALENSKHPSLSTAERLAWREKALLKIHPRRYLRDLIGLAAAWGVLLSLTSLSALWVEVVSAAVLFIAALRVSDLLQALAIRAPLSGMPLTFMRFESLWEKIAPQRVRPLTLKGALRKGAPGRPAVPLSASTGLERTGTKVTSLYLGEGFFWDALKTQRLYTLSDIPAENLRAGPFVRKLFGYPGGLDPREVGLPVLHGVGLDEEKSLTVPLSGLGGGTLIVGTTQSGKGVVLTSLVSQAIFRGEAVIVIDPKSSKRLRTAVRDACRLAGRAAPLEFHPAFPREGVRLDPLGSWSRPTELASRLTALLPADADIFNDFAWSAVNVIVAAMVFLEEKPTLLTIRHYLQAGIAPLLEAAIERDFSLRGPEDWAVRLSRIHFPGESFDKAPPPRVMKLISLWESLYKKELKGDGPQVIHPLINVYWHNADHYAKITASLLPILSMLTSGTLAETLSPDVTRLDEKRPVVSLERVIDAGDVLYLGLDAMPDAAVAGALGSLLLSDLTAYAGKRYNRGYSGRDVDRIALFVDETANVINRPMIELLNKGMEAGVHVTAAMQTVADLTAALKDRARAYQALANFNNLIALRTKDQETQRFVLETFGAANVWQESLSMGTAAGTEVLPHFRSSLTRSTAARREALIPQEMLGRLPNAEYFASVAGGRIFKGRMPIVTASGVPADG